MTDPSCGRCNDQAKRPGQGIVAGCPVHDKRIRLCPTRTPEAHLPGEFPMTCYRCHIEADS